MSGEPCSGQTPILRRPGTLLTFPNLVKYSDGWLLQQRFHIERREGRRFDSLLLLEHEPVYTLGRRTAPSHLPDGEAVLLASGAALESVNRGGSVTYHGPGQLVGYPILKLSDFAAGPKQYVRILEQVLIRTLALWDIDGHRIQGKPGLFVTSPQGTAKIVSIGVRVDRGITLHGFALNVDVDLACFASIVPCGLTSYRTTSIAEVRRSKVSMTAVRRQVADQFGQVFNLEWDDAIQDLPGYHTTGECVPAPAEKMIKEPAIHA